MPSPPKHHAIHATLIAAAAPFPRVRRAIMRNGPLEELNRRKVTPLAALGRIVVGQQLSTLVARSIWRKILRLQKSQRVELGELFLEHEAGLAACGVSGPKRRCLRELALASERGWLKTRALSQLSVEVLQERLVEIWGIGVWTARIYQLFYLGREDVWPEKDGSLIRALRQLSGDLEMDDSDAVDIANKFAPLRSYFALHLWRHLDAKAI